MGCPVVYLTPSPAIQPWGPPEWLHDLQGGPQFSGISMKSCPGKEDGILTPAFFSVVF